MNSALSERRPPSPALVCAALITTLAACEQKPSATVPVVHADLRTPESRPAEIARPSEGTSLGMLLAQARAAQPPPERALPPPANRGIPYLPDAPTGAGRPALSKPLTDTELAARVKSAVLAQPLSALLFKVSVTNGIVTLSGTADSDETRDKAGRAAAGVTGVKSVNNHINVISGS